MSYNIKISKEFEYNLKRLIKKYPSLKNEYIELIETLKLNPTTGISLGKNIYKIRISIQSKGKGKSGGGRIITYVHYVAEEVLLLTIYDKGERTSISDNDIKDIIDKMNDEI